LDRNQGVLSTNYQFTPHFLISLTFGYRLYSDIASIDYSVQDPYTGYEYETSNVSLSG